MADAVDDSSAFEVNRKFAIVPAADGGLAYCREFFIGQAEALQYGVLALAKGGQRQACIALFADGNLYGFSADGQRQKKGQQKAGARHAGVSAGRGRAFAGQASLLGLLLQNVSRQQLALGVGQGFELGADVELAILAKLGVNDHGTQQQAKGLGH